MTDHPKHPHGRLLRTWLALLALMSASCAMAFLPWGLAAKVAAGLCIAAIKAALVGRVFMRLDVANPALRVCAGFALAVWLVLVGLGALDVAMRAAPASASPAIQPMPHRREPT